MKKLSLLSISILAIVAGCSPSAEEPKTAAGDTSSVNAAPGKPEGAAGMSAADVQVTNAGGNADKMTGSKAGG